MIEVTFTTSQNLLTYMIKIQMQTSQD